MNKLEEIKLRSAVKGENLLEHYPFFNEKDFEAWCKESKVEFKGFMDYHKNIVKSVKRNMLCALGTDMDGLHIHKLGQVLYCHSLNRKDQFD